MHSLPTTPAQSLDDSDTELSADLSEIGDYYAVRGLHGESLPPATLNFILALSRAYFDAGSTLGYRDRGQIVIVGGAGAGKSTTVNVIVGFPAVESNAQAGYSRHPKAVVGAGVEFPPRIGPLTRLETKEAGNLDLDCFGIIHSPPDAGGAEFLERHLVWDCPDLTTKDAVNYERRVIEVAALADCCVYVASDERYNDELPTEFLQTLLMAGKRVVVVLTKVSPSDAEELSSLFRRQVLDRLAMSEHVKEVISIPMPVGGKVADLWTEKYPHGEVIRSRISEVLDDLPRLREELSRSAARFIHGCRDMLLAPLGRDLADWDEWVTQVDHATSNAVTRYEREYLERSETRAFNDSRDAVLSVFPLPGRWSPAWQVLEYARVPFRFAKSLFKRYTVSGDKDSSDERALVNRLRDQVVDSLVVYLSGRRERGRLWEALHSSLTDSVLSRFVANFEEKRAKLDRELDVHRRQLSERTLDRIHGNPMLLWGLRGGRVVLDLLAIVFALWFGYWWLESLSLWLLVFVLLALGLMDEFVQWACQEFVRREREEIVSRQRTNIRSLMKDVYGHSLRQLPAGVGERLARMSDIFKRLPQRLSRVIDQVERSSVGNVR